MSPLGRLLRRKALHQVQPLAARAAQGAAEVTHLAVMRPAAPGGAKNVDDGDLPIEIDDLYWFMMIYLLKMVIFPKSIMMINNDLMMRLRINGFFSAEWWPECAMIFMKNDEKSMLNGD